MADSPRHPDTGEDAGGLGSAPRMPRWVKVFGIVALILVVLVVVVLLIGGGNHGPGRHTAASTAVADIGGHASPEGGHG